MMSTSVCLCPPEAGRFGGHRGGHLKTSKMVTPKMAITDTEIRCAKGKSAPYKLYDDGGLLIIISPAGSKLWRLKYRFHGKEQQLSLGIYPTVGLKEARRRRDEAKELLDSGLDPAAEKRRLEVFATLQANNTFKLVAEEYITKEVADGCATATEKKLRWLLKQLEPKLGGRPIADIQPFELLDVLRVVEHKGNLETALHLASCMTSIIS